MTESLTVSPSQAGWILQSYITLRSGTFIIRKYPYIWYWFWSDFVYKDEMCWYFDNQSVTVIIWRKYWLQKRRGRRYWLVNKIFSKYSFRYSQYFLLVKAERNLILLAVLVFLFLMMIFFFLCWHRYYGVRSTTVLS